MELPEEGTVRYVARNFVRMAEGERAITSLKNHDRLELARLFRSAPSFVSHIEERPYYEVTATSADHRVTIGPAYIFETHVILRGNGYFFPLLEPPENLMTLRLG